jgi:hypothetical protein
MALKVLSAPVNGPTLNPKVQPVNQPAFSPKVAPVQQPAFNPQVQSQPQNQPKITSLGTATNQQAYTQKLSLDEFAQTIKQKYPEYADRDNATLAQAMLSKYPQYQDKVYTPVEQPQSQGDNSFGHTAKEMLKFGLSGGLYPNDISKGALKGVVSTAYNTTKLLGKGLEKLTGVKNQNSELNPDLYTPSNTAQKTGFYGEQVGEFFLPGGLVSKAGKAADAGIQGLNLGTQATKTLQLAGKAGLGAVESAGITAAQGGDASDVKLAAGLGAGFTVAAKGIESVLKRIPQTAWSSILKRTPTEASKNPKLTQQAAETGLTGFTRQSIANKAQEAIQSIEVTLDDLLNKRSGQINTAKVVGYLGDLRNSYSAIPGEKSSVKAIDDIAGELYESFKSGQPMTLIEANQLKRNIYSVISKSYGKGMLELPAKTEAQKLVAAGLKREIEKVIPEVKTLNEKQAVYIQIKKALDKTIARTEGKGIAGTGVGLYDLLLGGIGTGAGALAGNPFIGLGLVATKKTAESPGVLSATAKLLNHFNQLSPTKKLLFYQALKGMIVEAGTSSSSDSPSTEQ